MDSEIKSLSRVVLPAAPLKPEPAKGPEEEGAAPSRLQQPAPPAEKKAIDGEELRRVVEEMNDHLQQSQRSLEFTVDDDSGKTVVKVIDSENQQVIRQIPSEEMVEIARKLKEMVEGGLIFRERA